MNTKNTVVVVRKKKKNYIYSKIPRFQAFAGGRLDGGKTMYLVQKRCFALASAVKRSRIIRPTSFVLFKNWNFGIFTGYPQVIHEIRLINQRLSKVPILCSRLEQLYIRD